QLNPGAITRTVAGSARSAVFTGLTNGTSYSVRVRARNAAGLSEWSAFSAPETPAGVPVVSGPPTLTRGDGQATVTWSAASANGAPVDAYRIYVNGAQHA